MIEFIYSISQQIGKSNKKYWEVVSHEMQAKGYHSNYFAEDCKLIFNTFIFDYYELVFNVFIYVFEKIIL